ncbi:hypothetical protein [Pseudonocardia pini]|uniref:hypothetical protein n=1 Tax=Pseudonocardia pini TaxID=2758030 RepID=UPI0015F08A46|nr:hypothetical protein [Pseudonocardia pini]
MPDTAPPDEAPTTVLPADTAEPAPTQEPVRPSGFGRRGVIVLVVLALLLASTIATGVLWLSGRGVEADRAAALDAARAAAVSLSSISADTADADVQRVLDSGTGEFGDLFRQNLGSYVQMVKDSQVGSTGEVTAAALSEADEDSAKALVAVRSEVRNSQSPDPQPRLYRMQMDLVKEGDRWLVATLTFAG